MVRIIIACGFTVLSTAIANAEQLRLNLKDSIVLAVSNNRQIRAAGFNADAAQHGIAVSVSRYYPSVMFEENFSVSNSPTQSFMMKLDEGRFSQDDFQIANLNKPGTHHDFKTAVTLYQPLFDPAIGPMKEIASRESDKQGQSYETVRQLIAFSAFRHYLQVQKTRTQATAAEQAVVEARENLRLATVRSANGIGLKSDELRARTNLALAEQQIIAARNRQVLAGLQLANILNLSEGEEVVAEDAIAEIRIDQTPEELLKTALENRSDLKLFRSELERAEAGIRLAGRGYLPTLGAVASYQLNAQDAPFGADNNAWNAGISFKWQLFDGFRRNCEQSRAQAERSAAAELLANRVQEVRLEVRESLLRREEAGKRLDVARHALADSEETVRLLSRRFENSLSTLVELLDAQTVLNRSRANLIESEADYALAGGEVLQMAGIFLKEMQK